VTVEPGVTTSPPLDEPDELEDAEPRRWRRWVLAFLALGTLGAGGALTWSGWGRSEAVVVGPTARVTRGAIERIVLATGTIEPDYEVEVRPRVSGIVERIFVERGEAVERGQPLIRLDDDLIALQVREVRAKHEAAQAEYEQAEREFRRFGRLYEEGALPETRYEQARARTQVTKAVLDQASARLRFLQRELSHATIEAPIDGVVTDLYVKRGTAVSSITSVTAGTPLLLLADLDRFYLNGLVDENEIGSVALDQPVRIETEVDGLPKLRGTVREIIPTGQRRQNVTYFPVEVEIADVNGTQLRPRMSADGEIVAEVVEGTLLMPETALRYDGDRVFVERVRRDPVPAIEERDVSVGIISRGRAQVLSGLELGDEVRLQ